MQIKTANTILYCRNWQESVRFYKTILGLKVLSERDWFIEFELTETARLSIADQAKTSIESSGGKGVTLTFEVYDSENTHLYLKGAGLDPPAIKQHSWGAKVIYIRDPENNRIEFWSAQ